ncbi:MAG: SGNH/GDSL hydrolase family protein, partial [Lachnospiraceae bacterium]|nr:SGNH/GDSL hydrolase family protein [Lachnospiraceae bacterium]
AGEPIHVRFCFQMYGHKDPYVSGTTLTMDVLSDGMERVLDIAGAQWTGDDNITGQIRFEFDHAGEDAEVSVCLYLNDGYTAPPQAEDKPIAFGSDGYNKMIARSLMQEGNTYRIKKAIDKARRGEDTTLAFIGGSITQGAGAIPINKECYAYKIFTGFCDLTGREYDDNVKYIKAGVGGTPSELGMLRYQRDVLNDGKGDPDLVVIEFAVNDEGDETKGDCYDSLARKIYNGPGHPGVILLFSVFADDYNLQDRLKCVGEAYNLPMVSVKNAVVPQFNLSEEEGRILTRSQYFYDVFHPTNAGHTIMADSVLHLMRTADSIPSKEEFDINTVTPPKSADFENVYYAGRDDIDSAKAVLSYETGSFTGKETALHYCERDLDLFGTPEFPDNWLYDGSVDKSNPVFKLKVHCRNFLVAYMDSASPAVGKATVYADGKEAVKIDPHIVGWQHANALIVVREPEAADHEIEIRINPEDIDKKFILLGFGITD